MPIQAFGTFLGRTPSGCANRDRFPAGAARGGRERLRAVPDLSPAEVALELGCPFHGLQGIENGSLAAYKIGTAIRVSPEAVERLKRENRIQARPGPRAPPL
jgi:hypothetical protein